MSAKSKRIYVCVTGKEEIEMHSPKQAIRKATYHGATLGVQSAYFLFEVVYTAVCRNSPRKQF
jgi:hypothetical protein